MISSLKIPNTLFWGNSALDSIPDHVRGHYQRAAVFTDSGVQNAGLLDKPIAKLEAGNLKCSIMPPVPPEPDYEQVQGVLDEFSKSGADYIVAIGGGSVMDVAKLASITAGKCCSVLELLETPSLGQKTVDSLMIPTTAGTGAEATPNAIVAVPEKAVKVGIVNFSMMPDAVVLDGQMTASLPAKIAASTGVDALCHAVECFTSNKRSTFSNMFSVEAVELIFRNLEETCKPGSSDEARDNMLLGAFYGGVSIAASGTTAVHALSYPLGGRYHIPHGAANAMLLMPVLQFNREVCQDEYSALYDRIWDGAGLGKEEKSQLFLEKSQKLIESVPIPSSLSEYGIGSEDLDDLVASGMQVTRLLDNNKRKLSSQDAREIYLSIMK